MRVTIQRVSEASVSINGFTHNSINRGLLVFLGITSNDDQIDIEWLCKKIVSLRIFSDEVGKMNRSIIDDAGEILLISQFTLFASIKKGNRPSFISSAPPMISRPIYDMFHKCLEEYLGKEIATGKFGADMKVHLCNDGPVTINIDSKKRE